MRVPEKDIYILVHPYTYIRNMTSLYLTVISGCNGIYEVLQCARTDQIYWRENKNSFCDKSYLIFVSFRLVLVVKLNFMLEIPMNDAGKNTLLI